MKSMVKIKWKMNGHTSFTGESDGYIIDVRLGGLGWIWSIVKDGVMLDNAYGHSPTKCELSCKVQAEKVLNSIVVVTTPEIN